jgi:hypothetical protein
MVPLGKIIIVEPCEYFTIRLFFKVVHPLMLHLGRLQKGAMTFSIMTLSTTTISIKIQGIKGLYLTVSLNDTQHK